MSDDQNIPPDSDDPQNPSSEFLLYTTEDGKSRVECRIENETIWLSQKLMSDLFDLFEVEVPTINEHLKTLYESGEIDPDPTIRKFRIVRQEGKRKVARVIEHYNLDAILAVGYRVREIFSLAADYEPSQKESVRFFQIIQNKLHFAATGHTAAELITEGRRLKLEEQGAAQSIEALENLSKNEPPE